MSISPALMHFRHKFFVNKCGKLIVSQAYRFLHFGLPLKLRKLKRGCHEQFLFPNYPNLRAKNTSADSGPQSKQQTVLLF